MKKIYVFDINGLHNYSFNILFLNSTTNNIYFTFLGEEVDETQHGNEESKIN